MQTSSRPGVTGRLTIGVLTETAAGERRVALVPEALPRLHELGALVMVQTGAGEAAGFADHAYTEAGAVLADAAMLAERADVLVCLSRPAGDGARAGQLVVGVLQPLARPGVIAAWAERGVSAISLDLLPRTLSRAQAMDALTSQANLAGYKAALVAADAYDGYFPMLMTAAGTIRPATVLVLGAGVAGLAAIGTARRLGAVVTAYDVRPQARAEVRSVGARFLDLDTELDASGGGGYARELTAAERVAQQRALDERISGFDIVITSAAVPGRRPPLLVTEAALRAMRPGSVVVDTAAGPLGGNVAGSEPDTTITVPPGVTVIGAGNLPASMPRTASTAYAHNVTALLATVIRDGELRLDLAEEVQAATLVCHGGVLLNQAVSAALRQVAA
jgi:proton-translocating NAD(P)+ transhydrogenase subunit alpha